MAVMGLKTGVKNWSDAPQNEIQKIDKTHNLSPQDTERLGGENIGLMANKIADPNYIDPSKKMRAVGNNQLDKDAFMKLMLAQMKNQDPGNPMKSHEMAAQLAQFTSVEQMMNMNQTLSEMRNAQKPTESFQALQFIGKAVGGDAAKVIRTKGDKEHDFKYVLPEDAQKITITVRNPQGELVRKVDFNDIKKGEHNWTWDGKDESGNMEPVGEYKFVIEAKTSANKKLAVKTDFEGIITGVNYTAEGPVLMIGNQSIRLKDVRKIIDPSLTQKDQKMNVTPNSDLKKEDGASENVEKGTDQLVSAVGMSRDMMAKLEKEAN